jgi:NAD(P)-dependent dehydrogenase (short-subunit alcohol dehydrogenase family)
MPTERPEQLPPQQQEQQPGFEGEMTPKPQSEAPYYRGSGKLKDKVAIITGGDSGIGRSVAVLFAREGADVAIGYLNEHEDAAETRKMVEEEGGRCLLVPGDVGNRSFCRQFVQQVVDEFGRLDVLVNNAAVQYVQEELEGISEEQLEKTFRTNVYSMFFLTQAALEHMKEGSSIINTTSVTAFQGNETLIDYSSTKGAILAFTRALSQNLADKNIRVNAVAPGPIWTPLIPASFPPEKVEAFGKNTPMGRPGQPEEVAPCYVFLASEDASYITGQTLHPNGGRMVGG